jgi:hypothetical protein
MSLRKQQLFTIATTRAPILIQINIASQRGGAFDKGTVPSPAVFVSFARRRFTSVGVFGRTGLHDGTSSEAHKLK